MCTVAGVRQASACRAWARPISPPSAVTAALLDMFCGLKGRTVRPRLANRRHSPATRWTCHVGTAALDHQRGHGPRLQVVSAPVNRSATLASAGRAIYIP